MEGNSKEVRYPGTFTAGVANDEPHTEGGGVEDVVILFSLRPYSKDKPIYEILDDNGEIASIMTFDALKELHETGQAWALEWHSAISITLDRYGHVLEENAISEMDNLYSTMRELNQNL